ncbi:MAG: hypothetical protein Aurels2KO_04910 [Aureliella sp.]
MNGASELRELERDRRDPELPDLELPEREPFDPELLDPELLDPELLDRDELSRLLFGDDSFEGLFIGDCSRSAASCKRVAGWAKGRLTKRQ